MTYVQSKKMNRCAGVSRVLVFGAAQRLWMIRHPIRQRFRNGLQKLRATAVICLCSALISCGQVPLVDVSAHAEYKEVIDTTFGIKHNLLLIGVTADQNYKKQVDYIVLVTSPGFNGPEVVTTEQLSKGSFIRVVGVLQSKSIMVRRVYYVVVIADAKPRSAPIRIRQTGSVQDANRGLDPTVFEKL